MADIWVDPTFGSDGNSGLNPANAKATISAGYGAVTAGATLWLLSGSYTDQLVGLVLSKANVTIRAAGAVRLINTSGASVAAAFTGSSVPSTTKLIGLRFEQYTSLLYYTLPGAFGQITSTSIHMKNCVFSRTSAGSNTPLIYWEFGTGYRATLQLRMERCTARNFTEMFTVRHTGLGGAVPGPTISIERMRNCIFSGYTNFAKCVVDNVNSATSRVEFLDANYDAFSGAVGSGNATSQFSAGTTTGGPPTEADGFYSHTPDYTDTGSSPPDLSIAPDSGSALIGGGENGVNVGAPFWPAMYGGTDTFVGTTDWANWSNDERWFDTGLETPGVDGPSDASPAVLTVAEPRVWLIHPSRGQQKSARVLGPVWDFGTSTSFKGVFWKAIEVSPTNRISSDQNYTEPTPGTQIEVRYSNTAFGRTDSSPSNWTEISKTELPSITARYWQIRAVLRTDAF